jgi:phosphoglycolate phosphatase
MERMDHLFSNIDAVLFDLDGTLVETNIDFSLMKREMISLAVDSGLPASDLAPLDILAIVERMTDHARNSRGVDVAEKLREEAFLILEEMELRHSADARDIPPARDIVNELRRKGIRVGIVTRNCRAASEESLARTGIVADALVSREDVARTKPDPEHLLHTLRLLSADPSRSVMVGDHLMDVISGKSAGMRTIGVLTDERGSDYFSSVEPDAVTPDLNEILRAIIHSNS